MKKTWTLVVISLLGLALFSACASNADTLPSPAPSASVTPSAMPEATPAPSASAMPSATVQPAGVNTVEDARRLSDDVSEEVEKLSELDDARQNYLLTRMTGKQVFVTACDSAAFGRAEGRVYRLENGAVTQA